MGLNQSKGRNDGKRADSGIVYKNTMRPPITTQSRFNGKAGDAWLIGKGRCLRVNEECSCTLERKGKVVLCAEVFVLIRCDYPDLGNLTIVVGDDTPQQSSA
jgi:hypothetical protein